MAGEPLQDRQVPFTIPARDARGRVVRLEGVLGEILAAHDYPAPLKQLLAEALVLTALMGALLKDDDSQMTLQIQSEKGAVDLLVCDYLGGALRGYLRHDAAAFAALGEAPSLGAIFPGGYLAITFDLATTDQRYQGIIPIEGESLAAVCETYFSQSEQVPTLIRLGVDCAASPPVAGGLLVQHLPEGEEGRARLHVELEHPHWQHVAALAGSMSAAELADRSLSEEDLLWRLFHEEAEVRVLPAARLVKGCRCTAAYYQSVLARFPAAEIDAMRDEAGHISVDCAFCSKQFAINI